jgi:iron complex transport system ATP-binding protein
MLKAENITYDIGRKTLLSNVSVEFSPGKLNLIIGPNGAGKSTLVKVLSRQIIPRQGNVYYGEKNIKSYSDAGLASFRAVLSQSTELVFPLLVSEVVMMGRYPHFITGPTAHDKRICEEAVKYFGIENLADQYYHTLSGGEKQRVHFARVMAQVWPEKNNELKYLFLDEPLAFLDIYYQFDFMNKLKRIIKNQNLLVAGVVHDLNLAARYGGHIVMMKNGEIYASGSPADVLTVDNLKAVYRMEPHIIESAEGIRVYF